MLFPQMHQKAHYSVLHVGYCQGTESDTPSVVKQLATEAELHNYDSYML